MRKKEFTRLLILRTIGNFLILFMIFGLFTTFSPALFYEAKFRIDKIRGVSYKVADANTTSELGKVLEKYKAPGRPSESFLGKTLSTPTGEILIPQSTEFAVMIPKIGANERVITNVDPANEKEYLDALTSGIAHARGSALPGMNGTTYLFAHSADNFWNVGRYNAVFYLLKDLEVGDQVVVFFQNKRYNYSVTDKKIVDPESVEFINLNIGRGEELILQTCWPPGTTWKRLLVFAKPV